MPTRMPIVALFLIVQKEKEKIINKILDKYIFSYIHIIIIQENELLIYDSNMD